MICDCSTLPDIFKVGSSRAFEYRKIRIATGDWVHIHKCVFCNQLWQVDEPEKYCDPFIIRIPTGTSWELFDSSLLRKKFIIQSRGGTTNEKCCWAGCINRTVFGVAYCVDHLYETGARE